ncbi:DUF1801 domain-containing protein [Muriicola sp. Z0-33]|uniref:DUF1801 domain-containing protein n=1 Tax=Muriicola sp. Z0-33 TaxID=2816957 RepID=UPI002238CC8D|nr:DUF1801 domain-containing protein [Muriicola sp. Z0-33]MCW5518052.1 DUF1801 domain-containing protein [Muriicola sp. Z0-33]
MNPAEEYILRQPEPFRGILLHLQTVIEQTVPGLDLKYKYKVPFYYLDGKPFCYLNQARDYVDLGFWKAAHLTAHPEFMTTAGRKMMKSLRYSSLEEINHDILVEVLQDAFSVKDKKFYS